MLADIQEHIGTKDSPDPAFIKEVISGGHFRALDWEFPGNFSSKEVTEQVVQEVGEILTMWEHIEEAHTALGQAEKDDLAAKAHPFGVEPSFRGFDGNNETEHMSVAGLMIEKMGRFTHFAGRDMNSHMPSLDAYERMLKAYEPHRRGFSSAAFGVDELAKILLEQVHPENRVEGVTH